MARSRRLKIPVEDKVRVVLSVLSGEMSAAEAARRRRDRDPLPATPIPPGHTETARRRRSATGGA